MSILASVLGTAAGAVMDIYKMQQQQSNFERQLDFNALEARRAREFSASESQLAYERELESDSTKYQRQVADLKAAGINPMMVASGGAGSVHASPGSASMASAPGAPNLGGLMQNAIAAQQLAMQKELNDSQKDLNAANAAKARSEANKSDVESQFLSDTAELRKSALSASVNLTDAQIDSTQQEIRESRERVAKLIKETESEEARKELMVEQSVLAKANAWKIHYMTPFEANLAAAQTDAQKAKASLDYVVAAREQGLLDNGFIDAYMSKLKSEAQSAADQAFVDDVRKAVATGDFSPLQSAKFDSLGEKIVYGLYSGIRSIRTALSPLK